MPHLHLRFVLLSCLCGSVAVAQEGSGINTHPCDVEPVFHCAELLSDGRAIGHFGYTMTCPAGVNITEQAVQLGDNNAFSPPPVDRGQPILFEPGEHFDEYEVEFLPREIKSGKDIHWTVLDRAVTVDFSRTKDATVVCASLP